MRRIVALLALVFAAASALAQLPDLHWRLVGPFRGGRVLAVTGVAGEPEHFYFGSVNGGVWETIDAGRTWNPIFDGQPAQSIGAIAVAPSNPRVLYAGTGEADMRSDIAQGDGMYKSADGGKSWTHIGLANSQQIARVLVHPDDPDVVYVAALGHPYAANAERGVFRSRDGGRTWQRVLSRNNDSDTGAIDLAFEPGNPSVLYAALWQTRRTPWSVYPPSSGPGSGLFKSSDGGEHWTEIHLTRHPGRIGIAVAPSNPRRVYAIVDDPDEGGMYRSDDAGATWTRSSSDSRIWSRGWYFGGVTVEPDNADVVYSININVYRSDDGGHVFVPVKGAPGGDDYHTLWIDPHAPRRRILGVDQGCVVSVDGGATWSSWYNQPTGQFYHVSTDNRFPYWLYGPQQDSGAASVPSRTNAFQDGITITSFRELTAGGEADNVIADPQDPEVIYGGRVSRLDTRSGQTRQIDPTLAHLELDRRTWTLPLAFSPRDPRALYFANQRLFRTTDGGEHWDVISPDLTRENPGIPPNLDPATAALQPGNGKSTRFGVIYAIAPSRTADRDVWVGTDDGQIWRTRDDGAHWTNITPPQLTPWSKVGIIDASHFDSETAYAAVDRHRLDDFRPYVYRTHDGGKTWTLISNGLPTFVNAVREDSVRKGLLYAATERGVSVSFDDGDHWQSLQLNLPSTSVRDIDVHGNDLVIATHGRAFWILDDVTPLRQLPAAGAPFLFQPADAIRVRPSGFTGTPMPKDEPQGTNPPSGASIDYVASGGGPVTLDIFDAAGALVRRYSSTDALPQPSPRTLQVAPEWFAMPVPLAAGAGFHRFVWPLRYPPPDAKSAYADGVFAPPGEYKLVLTADGKPLTRTLRVLPDPRVPLPASAYADEFALAREVEALRARVSAALEEASDPKYAQYASISGVVPGGANVWWVPPSSTTTLRYLDGALQKLLSALENADAAPSPDARASWAKLQPAAEAALAAWAKVR
jgi:photosystem II stability/assembly factor-like uncharacterized protein